jgi:hypothetical protein
VRHFTAPATSYDYHFPNSVERKLVSDYTNRPVSLRQLGFGICFRLWTTDTRSGIEVASTSFEFPNVPLVTRWAISRAQ